MKKVIMIVLAALLLLSLAACSAPAGPAEAVPSQSQDATSGEGAPDANGDAEDGEALFGKVKSLVGNEVSLDLAKTPEGGLAGAVGEDGAYSFTGGKGGENISITRSESAASGADEAGGDSEGQKSKSQVIAVEGEDGQAHVITPSGSGDAPKMELEYTGESKDLTIPTGLPITDLFGNELKASDLKEGNVLMVSFGQDGSISSILVME